MRTATVYGRTAYEGFAKAIGSKLGLTVTIDEGVNACIDDQGTIRLPGMHKHQTATEFAVTCGVIVHELSHQFYGSHRLTTAPCLVWGATLVCLAFVLLRGILASPARRGF